MDDIVVITKPDYDHKVAVVKTAFIFALIGADIDPATMALCVKLNDEFSKALWDQFKVNDAEKAINKEE